MKPRQFDTPEEERAYREERARQLAIRDHGPREPPKPRML